MRIFTELSATLIFLLSFFGLSQVSICEPRSAPNPTVCSVVREAKDERALLNVEHRWAQALEQRDSAAIECLLAPEFVDIDANGELHDRAHVIGAVVNRKPWLNHLEDMRVTLGENAAVVHGLNRVTDQRSKELARVRFTDVFFYGNGQWKAISSHETLAHSAVGSKQSATHSSVIHESLQDTWWTGPLLAPSAATLPRGHFLIEPYLYDVILQGHYDRNGVRRSAPHSNGFGSLTYLLYGLADRVSVGLIPTLGYNEVSKGPSSSGVGLGDLTVQAQYRLTQFHKGHWIPTTSVALQETFPTGKYDRLANRPTDGLGNGAYTTTVALYSQTYFWLLNGRILRMRMNVSQAFSNTVKIADASVYGTEAGFRAYAKPGGSFFLDGAWEYSLTQRWVLALDATYGHNGKIRVAGYDIPGAISTRTTSAIHLNYDSSDAFSLAPAIEYNLNRKLGFLVGVRVIPAGRNMADTITPAVAINFVH